MSVGSVFAELHRTKNNRAVPREPDSSPNSQNEMNMRLFCEEGSGLDEVLVVKGRVMEYQ